MNAAHYRLGNLVAIVDHNGLEADGTLDEVTGLGDIAAKYAAFGWRVHRFDGNDIAGIKRHFDALPAPDSDVPTVFVCDTVKGCGVPFMEGQLRWHAGKITPEQYEQCVQQLEAAFATRGC